MDSPIEDVRAKGPSTVGLLIVGVVVGLGIGLALGTRGERSASSHESSAPDLMAASVSQRLRDTYYGSGGTQVCVIGNDVHCTRVFITQSETTFRDITLGADPDEVSSITPTIESAGRVLVVGDFGPLDGALVRQLDGAGHGTDLRRLEIINPNDQGIDYVDLGATQPGLYLVAVNVRGWVVPTALVVIRVNS